MLTCGQTVLDGAEGTRGFVEGMRFEVTGLMARACSASAVCPLDPSCSIYCLGCAAWQLTFFEAVISKLFWCPSL